MKKLDKLILKAFAGPFLLTFAVVEFILLTHTLLKYLDDIVGKDLGTGVLLQLLFFFSVLIVPISLPLAVLLSSLMTYGSLGEHHELTAIKASGVALTRILRPVWLVSMVLAVLAFWFNERIVPKANLKAYSLLWDVRQKKLALDIRPGVFYNGIPGYTIKVDKKVGPDKDILMGIMIYDHTQKSGNATVMLADSGRMFTRFGGQYLGFELFRGHSYIEQPDARDRSAASFIREGFKRNMITFSLASFNLDRTKQELFQTNRMMLNIPQLIHGSDSIQRSLKRERKLLPSRMGGYYTFLRFDTAGRAQNRKLAKLQVPATRLGPLTAQQVEQALNRARNVNSFITSTSQRLYEVARDSAEFRIEIYRKYTQSTAVLLMFLIGAPLGAIIKKGGLGVPILVSILFFIVFYVFDTMGSKYGRDFVLPVGVGMWLSNSILFPFGLFFLYQAYNDSGLLEMDFWRRLAQRLPRFPRLRQLAAPVRK
ncbi:LptF/LptG family permease [Hymenobacter baengnokdamensis]|uniref:LptF/LptG family permease n=1 Tax=Hymenobacter baengnokdamensis TaxID=2615203 RepID=UPI0012479BFE|nr:LptF/LptG family permease [Hymenobacter baengnokdamensis]